MRVRRNWGRNRQNEGMEMMKMRVPKEVDFRKGDSRLRELRQEDRPWAPRAQVPPRDEDLQHGAPPTRQVLEQPSHPGAPVLTEHVGLRGAPALTPPFSPRRAGLQRRDWARPRGLARSSSPEAQLAAQTRPSAPFSTALRFPSMPAPHKTTLLNTRTPRHMLFNQTFLRSLSPFPSQ